MTRYTLIVVLAQVLVGVGGFAAGCDNDPGEGKPQAEVAEPEEVAESEEAEPGAAEPDDEAAEPGDEPAAAPGEAAAAAAGKGYTFSNDGSTIAFVGAKVTGKHDGSFSQFSGTVDVVDGDPTKSTVSVEIKTASISADEEKLTKHLKSKDFFDVEGIPTASFRSTQVKAGGADGATHTVTGNLTLHGVTKAITFPATISVEEEEVEVDAEFVINRKDFGIVYPGMPDDLIKDEVLIKLDIEAKPAA